MEDLSGDLVASLDSMISLHEDFGFYYRHDFMFLGESGVAPQSMRVDADTGSARQPIGYTYHSSPLGELRTDSTILSQALPQTIETLRYRLTF